MMSLFLPLALNLNIDADTDVGECAVCSLDIRLDTLVPFVDIYILQLDSYLKA